MRTGDIVLHLPSNEEWVVAWADHKSGYMAPCGWPTCQALISDCTIIREATDAEYKGLIDQLSNSGRSDAHKAAEIARAALKEASDG